MNKSFDLDHLDNLVDYLDDVETQIDNKLIELQLKLEAVIRNIYDFHLSQVNDFTGELKESMYVNVAESDIDHFLIEVGNSSDHAVYVEYGTGAYLGNSNTWIVHISQLPPGAVKAYGFKEKWKNSNFYEVHGQRPKLFLNNTYLETLAVVDKVIREVFSTW